MRVQNDQKVKTHQKNHPKSYARDQKFSTSKNAENVKKWSYTRSYARYPQKMMWKSGWIALHSRNICFVNNS